MRINGRDNYAPVAGFEIGETLEQTVQRSHGGSCQHQNIRYRGSAGYFSRFTAIWMDDWLIDIVIETSILARPRNPAQNRWLEPDKWDDETLLGEDYKEAPRFGAGEPSMSCIYYRSQVCTVRDGYECESDWRKLYDNLRLCYREVRRKEIGGWMSVREIPTWSDRICIQNHFEGLKPLRPKLSHQAIIIGREDSIVWSSADLNDRADSLNEDLVDCTGMMWTYPFGHAGESVLRGRIDRILLTMNKSPRCNLRTKRID